MGKPSTVFTALGALLARSVAPAVAEHLAHSGVQVLQARLARDPSLAPATSAEIVAAINHYNATPDRPWTRERLFAFVAFFVSADADGTVGWIESPARVVGYVLRGARPGEEAGERASAASALEAEMENVRELVSRYLNLLTSEPAAAASLTATSASNITTDLSTVTDPGAADVAGSAGAPADPTRVRLSELIARVKTPAGAAISTAANATKDRISLVQQNARAASAARRARAAIEQSLKLLHAGGVGLAQAETYLLRKGYPSELVQAVVAQSVRGN